MPLPETKPTDVAVAALRDATLPPKTAACTIVTQCQRALQLAEPTDRSDPQDTPGLEGFFWAVWDSMLEIAMTYPGSHERLVATLAVIKMHGSDGCEGWRLWGSESLTWGDFPILGPAIAEQVNAIPCAVITNEQGRRAFLHNDPAGRPFLEGDPPTDTAEYRAWACARSGWINFHAFIAHLWVWDLRPDEYGGWALFMATHYLEACVLPPEARPFGWINVPLELGVVTAATYLRIAGAAIYTRGVLRHVPKPPPLPVGKRKRRRLERKALSKPQSLAKWKLDDGFHPERWAHWKDILRGIAEGGWRPSTTEAAKSALEVMEKAEREADNRSEESTCDDH